MAFNIFCNKIDSINPKNVKEVQLLIARVKLKRYKPKHRISYLIESNQLITTLLYKLKSNFKVSVFANFSRVFLSPCSINFFVVLVEKSAFWNIVGDSDSLLVILVTDFISAP